VRACPARRSTRTCRWVREVAPLLQGSTSKRPQPDPSGRRRTFDVAPATARCARGRDRESASRSRRRRPARRRRSPIARWSGRSERRELAPWRVCQRLHNLAQSLATLFPSRIRSCARGMSAACQLLVRLPMRTRACLLALLSAVSMVTACSAGSGGERTSNQLSTSDPQVKSAIPLHHRPAASSCAPTPLPAQPSSVPPASSSDAGTGALSRECATNADCTAAPNGRCVDVTGCNPSTATCGTHCVYEECTQDDDCGSGSACFCSDDATFCAGGYATSCPLLADTSGGVCACGVANQCKKGNCRVDSDCGQGGYCSPGIDDCGAVLGYYCHTAADECVNDEDCAHRDGGPLGYLGCLPDPSTGYSRWVCTQPAECP
jgi:hypothetical protein